jgi:ABC-2 type transport system permease protein
MNKFFLKLLMLPSGLWRGMGVDTEQLSAILNVKLILDDRKPIAIGRQRQQKKDRKGGLLLNMFISLVMGCFYTLPIIAFDAGDRIISLTIYFSLFLLLLSLTLVTDFSNVLFDTRDKYIILTRPVDDRTIVLARLLHVFIYLFRMVIPMSLPGWIALGVMDGWKSAVVFPFTILLLVFLVLFLVNGCYLLIIKIAKPEKFKDVINGFQIISSIAFFATVYLLPRAFRDTSVLNINMLKYPWLRFVPSYWLASCWSWIGASAILPGTKLLGILAIVFPLVCLYVLIRWLAPSFGRNIGAIDVSDGGDNKTATGKKVKASTFYNTLANIFNRNDEAKAGFIITWLQTSRSRSFRMRVYPSFAFVPIYFIYMLTMDKTSLSNAFHTMSSKPRHLLLLYMCSFVLVQALTYLNISDHYKASWVYYSTPVKTPGNIMTGAFKAMWIKYFLPFFIIISIFVVAVWGLPAIMDIILALVNVTLFAISMARLVLRQLPFSLLEQMKQRGNSFVKAFLTMIIPVILGGLHFMTIVFHLFLLKIIFLVLSSILLWLVADSYKNTSWENVRRTELE